MNVHTVYVDSVSYRPYKPASLWIGEKSTNIPKKAGSAALLGHEEVGTGYIADGELEKGSRCRPRSPSLIDVALAPVTYADAVSAPLVWPLSSHLTDIRARKVET